MTLAQLQSRLKKYIPNLRIRQGGYADVASIYAGSNYLIRLNKGELHLYNWRESVVITDADKYFALKGQALPVGAKHRGRMQALNLLINMRWINSRQAQKVMWGI